MRAVLSSLLLLTTPALAQQPAPAPSPTTTTSRDTPFPGAVWATPTTPGKHPVIIVLGGSEGGTRTAASYAPRFAALGYATLGLPYYNPGWDSTDKTDGLPTTFEDIPVDRLAAVRDWLATQPQADADRIGVWGVSKGAEFALIAASHYPWLKAVAAIVPTDVVWEGWGTPGVTRSSFSFNGKPLAFQPYEGMAPELAKAARGEQMDLRRVHDEGRRVHPDHLAAARIPVERICAPVLVAGGGLDKIWPSYAMTQAIAASRAKARLPTVALLYPTAGHALSGPQTKPGSDYIGLGGEPAAIEAAQREVWAATGKLFADTLKAAKAPPARTRCG